MRKLLCALALALALACPTLAGEVHIPPAPQPPPPLAAEEATTDGDIPNPPLVQIVLSLLALF